MAGSCTTAARCGSAPRDDPLDATWRCGSTQRGATINSMKKPRLVLIVGAPGAGKTTLARHLGAALGFAVLTKDGLKEGLADELGSGDLVRSRELGQMA